MKKTIMILFILIPLFFYGETISDLKIPDGYNRIKYPSDSFSNWISNLKLKTSNKILTYNGESIENKYSVFAVIDLPLLFKQDLEQCADYAMRIWSEYHRENKKLDKLYLFNYGGEKVFFKDTGKKYRSFLKKSMAFSNSYSLKTGTLKISREELKPGDMIVQNEGGGIGHVSVIVDMVKNNKGKKLYLIGYSFMPAQEFHIERASKKNGSCGWFTLDGYFDYLKNNLDLGKPVLRRFE